MLNLNQNHSKSKSYILVSLASMKIITIMVVKLDFAVWQAVQLCASAAFFLGLEITTTSKGLCKNCCLGYMQFSEGEVNCLKLEQNMIFI